MSGWSWITVCATPDPVGKKFRKQSWSNAQNNVGIRLIWDPKKTQIEIIISMLFSNPPFLPKSLWSTTRLCAVLSPWTLAPMFGSIPTREGEGQKHPEQAGKPHEVWISLHKCAQFCLKVRVQCLWVPGSTYTYYPVLVWLPPTGSGVCHVHRPRGLCTYGEKVWLTTNFILSTCLFLVIELGRFWKGVWKKTISIKGMRWGELNFKQVDKYW